MTLNLALAAGGGGGGDAIGDEKNYPSQWGNPISLNGKIYIKVGTTLLASAYPNFPFTIQYGQLAANTTVWTDAVNVLSNNSYSTTPDMAVNDGASFVCIVSGDGVACSYSTDGGKTFNATSGLPGAPFVLYDLQYYASGNLVVAATSVGLITVAAGATSWTNRQTGAFYSVGINGANLVAVTTSSNATFYTSSNGTTWTTFASGLIAQYYTCVRYLNGAWLAVGGSTAQGAGTLYTSTVAAGTSGWAASSNTNFNSSTYCTGVTDIQYVGGFYVIVANLRSGNSCLSTGALNSNSLKYAGAGASSATSPNGGQFAWNGYYGIWAQNGNGNLFTINLSGNAVGSPSFSYNNSNYSCSGAITAFALGVSAGIFRIVTTQSSNSHRVYYTLVGTYLQLGGNYQSGPYIRVQ